MKNKLILTGTENDGFRHKYEIKKQEFFKDAFIDFMVCLGFKKERVEQCFLDYDEKENEIKLNVSDLKDYCDNFKNKDFDIDVFYGKRKIILLIRTKKKKFFAWLFREKF